MTDAKLQLFESKLTSLRKIYYYKVLKLHYTLSLFKIA